MEEFETKNAEKDFEHRLKTVLTSKVGKLGILPMLLKVPEREDSVSRIRIKNFQPNHPPQVKNNQKRCSQRNSGLCYEETCVRTSRPIITVRFFFEFLDYQDSDARIKLNDLKP